MRNIRFLGVWWHSFAVDLQISEICFPSNLGMMKTTKRNLNVCFNLQLHSMHEVDQLMML